MISASLVQGVLSIEEEKKSPFITVNFQIGLKSLNLFKKENN